MKRAAILLLGLLLLALAFTPIVCHLFMVAPPLVRAGHRRMALLSFIGCMAWLAIWLKVWMYRGVRA